MFKMCAQIYGHPTSAQSDGPWKILDPPTIILLTEGGGGSDMMLNNAPRSTFDLASPRSAINKESQTPPTVMPLTKGGRGGGGGGGVWNETNPGRPHCNTASPHCVQTPHIQTFTTYQCYNSPQPSTSSTSRPRQHVPSI
jgi:hypothetical protein